MYHPIKAWNDRKVDYHRGYRIIYVPEHPKNFGGWYYEHRLVMERAMNRLLLSSETVHHISGVKSDNTPNNLFLCSRKEHDLAI